MTRSVRSADTFAVTGQEGRDKQHPADQPSSIARLLQQLSDRSQLATHPSLRDAAGAEGGSKKPASASLSAAWNLPPALMSWAAWAVFASSSYWAKAGWGPFFWPRICNFAATSPSNY